MTRCCQTNKSRLATTTDSGKAVAVTLEPGDATFHHCRTLHFAGGNATDTPRYGVITHFWSAAA